MKWSNRLKHWLAAGLSLAVLASAAAPAALAEGEPPAQEAAVGETDPAPAEEVPTYLDYYETAGGSARPDSGIELSAAEASGRSEGLRTDRIEETDALLLEETGQWAEWSFTVPQDGAYSLYITYYPLEATGKDILLSAAFDGAFPFNEAEELSLPRIWADDLEEGAAFGRDGQGNDLLPEQVERPHFQERAFEDPEGLYEEPYLFELTAGTHTLRLGLEREAIAIAGISLRNEAEPVSYEEYIAQFSEDDYVAGEGVRQEAELTLEKSSSSLYPTNDSGDAGTLPNDPYAYRLNSMGRSNWTAPGSSVSWRVNVPSAGMYRVRLRFRQDENTGMNSYRTLRINGTVPFREAEMLAFGYKQGWQSTILQVDGEELWLYLEPGDTLTLSVTTGDMAPVLRGIRRSVLSLNALYREIIIITGTDPDIYRDYSLDRFIPDLAQRFQEEKEKLQELSQEVKRIIGRSGSQASTIDRTVQILDELGAETYTIPERLSSFKESIEGLGSLVMTLGMQPLELDCFEFLPKDAQAAASGAGLFTQAWFSIRRFFGSFVRDYSAVGGGSTGQGGAVNVWVTTGRDQAQILSRMIQDSFTNETGIPVVLNIVDTGDTLLRATMAGKGPDVALMIAETVPINLAVRGAICDLSAYGLEDIWDSFFPSAWTPFTFQGGVYAIPETQIFDVQFYRTDVFEQLGLEVPETWEEFYYVLEVLQRNNLKVGIQEINRANMGVSASITSFDRFLFQRSGQYYTDDLSRTAFDTEAAYQAFEEWTELYTKYKLDREFDFYSRFRSGEMPLAIQSYTAYNQLMQAAPELRGLWAFAPVPGTPREDGSIDRSESSVMTGCIMMKSAETKGIEDECVRFLKWWTSAESQTEYAKKLESILGVTARYSPASKEALSQLGWTDQELSILLGQMESVINSPQIPANYAVTRSLTNALRAAIKQTNRPRRSLAIYNQDINEEIQRKRQEFSLD